MLETTIKDSNLEDARNEEKSLEKALLNANLLTPSGKVVQAIGPVVQATGEFIIGQICEIERANGSTLMAEVTGLKGEHAILAPFDKVDGICTQSPIRTILPSFRVPVGDALLGRTLDALGRPMDKMPLEVSETYPAYASPPDPLTRPIIDTPFSLGVRALDSMLTCGLGQRLGIFAAAGGGKSTLMSMMVRFCEADIIIVALIGERGREVREFIEHQLGDEGRARSVVIVATSDRPAIEQVKAAFSATAIAEYFRDTGRNVLLLMDSVTRFARAQRQIGLSSGEPPTRRGFPPSVFELLPSLLERPGRSEKGTITALYTILVEGDDMNEPVADETRGLLDGHIILSRDLAKKGHYPAIDVLASASRVITNIINQEQLDAISKIRGLMARYNEIELLLRIGEYKKGTDPEADEAIEKIELINKLLQQRTDESSTFDETVSQLMSVVA